MKRLAALVVRSLVIALLLLGLTANFASADGGKGHKHKTHAASPGPALLLVVPEDPGLDGYEGGDQVPEDPGIPQ